MLRLKGQDGEHCVLHNFGGGGPPLLLTHGNGLNSGMWATVIPHLQNHRHCYGLDFRGHGASRVQKSPLDVDRAHLVQEIVAAVAAIGEKPIDAVGHSLGGATLVRAEMENPGLFRRLWLFEPVMVPNTHMRPDGDHPLVLAARRRRTNFSSVEEFVERLQRKPPFSECETAAVRAYAELGSLPTDTGIQLSCAGETEAQIFSTGTPTDFESLRTITAPTVVARGEAVAPGNELPPAMAQPIAESLAYGELLPMPGLTHFGPMENGRNVSLAVLNHMLS